MLIYITPLLFTFLLNYHFSSSFFEIFKKTASSDSPKNSSSSSTDNKLLRHLKAENSALRVKIQKIERDSSASSPKNKTGGSKFINSEASGTVEKKFENNEKCSL